MSVTGGDDEPFNYPNMFAGADVWVINKIDLLPYVDSCRDRLKENALKINPDIRFFETSAVQGTGLDAWCDFLCGCLERKEAI